MSESDSFCEALENPVLRRGLAAESGKQLLILPGGEHHERAGDFDIDTAFAKQSVELGVFGPRVKDHAIRVQAEDVIVVIALALRVEI